MTNIDDVHALIIEARAVLGGDRRVDALISACRTQLDAPLRIALAGTVKAGKSTLLNALVGEEITPSDATECTRVVTWFVQGRTPSVSLTTAGGTRSLPVERTDGRLTLDLDGTPADEVHRLQVTWPSTLLGRYTVVDTPGTASNSREVSARTMDLLAPPSGRPNVDAVIYLTRDLQPSDIEMLHRLRTGGTAGPLGVIAVHSRADEVHGGREWQAGQDESGFLPVSGLLALRGRTLRQSEFDAFVALAATPDLDRALVSVDRFARADLPLDTDVRRLLAGRFGLVGIRCGVSIVRSGVTSAAELASEMVARSGLTELERRIDARFGARHQQVAIRSTLLSLQKIVEERPDPRSVSLLTKIDRALADDHPAEELAVLASLQLEPIGTTPWQREAMERILGGHGLGARERLGVGSNADQGEIADTARAAARYWRGRLASPLLMPSAERAYRAAARSAEALIAGSSPPRIDRFRDARVRVPGFQGV